MNSESQGSFLRHYLDPSHQPPKHPYSTPSARGAPLWAGYRPKLNAMVRGSCQPDISEDTETLRLSGAPQGVASVSLQARLVPQAMCA